MPDDLSADILPVENLPVVDLSAEDSRDENSIENISIENVNNTVNIDPIDQPQNIIVPDNNNTVETQNEASTAEANVNKNEQNNSVNMTAAEKLEFRYKMSRQINMYDGDTVDREKFCEEILDLAEYVEAGYMPIFISVIMSKLKGKAREAIPKDPETVTVIVES